MSGIEHYQCMILALNNHLDCAYESQAHRYIEVGNKHLSLPAPCSVVLSWLEGKQEARSCYELLRSSST